MFLNDVGGSYRLKFTQEESDSFHAFFAGGVDSMTIEHFQDGMPKIGDSGDDAAEASAAASSAPRIIIAGAPASGKGTQCERIVEKYGIKHISTGDLLRAAVVAETELGQKAKGHMEKGELVPDELLIPLVADGLSATEEGWLLDGFPRTQPQAQALKDSGVVPDVLLVLDVPDEELTGRCVDRRLDPISGKIYHLKNNPPEDEEVALLFAWPGFYVERPFSVSSVEDHVPTRYLLYTQGETTLEHLREQGVSHVIAGRPRFIHKTYSFLDEATFEREFREPEAALEELLLSQATLVFEKGRYGVWRLE